MKASVMIQRLAHHIALYGDMEVSKFEPEREEREITETRSIIAFDEGSKNEDDGTGCNPPMKSAEKLIIY